MYSNTHGQLGIGRGAHTPACTARVCLVVVPALGWEYAHDYCKHQVLLRIILREMNTDNHQAETHTEAVLQPALWPVEQALGADGPVCPRWRWADIACGARHCFAITHSISRAASMSELLRPDAAEHSWTYTDYFSSYRGSAGQDTGGMSDHSVTASTVQSGEYVSSQPATGMTAREAQRLFPDPSVSLGMDRRGAGLTYTEDGLRSGIMESLPEGKLLADAVRHPQNSQSGLLFAWVRDAVLRWSAYRACD